MNNLELERMRKLAWRWDTHDRNLAMNVGDAVRKTGGDYSFEGVIVSSFTKRSGARRFVVEDDRGCLHIFNETQLEMIYGGNDDYAGIAKE